ncbi:hypothetical protein [Deinococcus sp. AJ005]|uniref:hypothetical protein n=1 Tax=Deinococcus sp. AJ005 TaxID=2652443 RepID=UPI00125CC8FC|nr:hypothetical protein [Deinococcus sp. AJ005]QFP75787.1 hypothetical protein DAAJ005_04455 [Deinococcus sp. AJ005]
MQINIAHINIQGQSCLICDAESPNHNDNARSVLLAQLVAAARAKNLRVDKSALAFTEHGRLKFYGSTDLVGFLVNNGLPRWTHALTV